MILPPTLQSNVNWLQRKIDRILNMAEKAPIEELQKAYPDGHWTSNIMGELQFTLPMDYALIDHVRKFMYRFQPRIKLHSDRVFVWDDSKTAGHFLTYRVDGEVLNDFEVAFRSTQIGATCVLNEIGKREVPIHEVVCAEGAEEKW